MYSKSYLITRYEGLTVPLFYLSRLMATDKCSAIAYKNPLSIDNSRANRTIELLEWAASPRLRHDNLFISVKRIETAGSGMGIFSYIYKNSAMNQMTRL